jgi:DNA-binding LacI/PurR family transcriptional regulator
VPEDIRFIGYDDIEEATHCKPPLSTVKMDKEALGNVAAQALIEGDIEPNDASLPVELVVRESSRAAARAEPVPARKARRQTAAAER